MHMMKNASLHTAISINLNENIDQARSVCYISPQVVLLIGFNNIALNRKAESYIDLYPLFVCTVKLEKEEEKARLTLFAPAFVFFPHKNTERRREIFSVLMSATTTAKKGGGEGRLLFRVAMVRERGG